MSSSIKSILTMLGILVFLSTYGQTANPKYDSALASQLGSDDYGMKMYVLVILKTGSNTTETKESKRVIFNGHQENIRRLVDLNKLIVAGPLEKNDNSYRGIFILNVASIEEATELLESDPAVKAKIFKPELYGWYGSAALPVYLETSDKIWKLRP